MSAARDAIFAAIAKASGPAGDPSAIRREAEALLAEPERVRPILPPGEPADLFEAAVARLPPGASVERVPGFEALPAAVARRLAERGLPLELKVQPVPAFADLPFAAAGLVATDAVDERVSLSLAEAGIAETATLLLRSGPQMAILDAFLPLHHLVAVRARDIVLHLEDALSRSDLAASRNLVLVTGPSGTTDIEGSLVIGVHGPATLHILIVD